jgi:prepilin-type processing-associated H-X9-DG protein
MAGAFKATQTPIAAYYCPSRRRVKNYPHPVNMAPNGKQARNADGGTSDSVNRSDYAGNGGEVFVHWGGGPASLNDGLNNTGFTNMTNVTGIIFQRSQVEIAMIRDGTTNTLLVAEKYLNPDEYETGKDWTDDHSCFNGDDFDINRWAYNGGDLAPLQDRMGFGTSSFLGFGSAHSGAFNGALCDGSVRNFAYDIDMTIFKRLCNRKDGQVLDASVF